MKKLLSFSFLMLAFAIMSFGQNKKVAVMETKNIQGVSPFQANIVRGGMETAVANAVGYEAYDRAAFDVIMKEQNFQRSGAVDDNQIREMGVMAGVQYVLVTEASTEDGYFYILAKLLDVETGRFMKSAEELCEAKPTDIKEACSKLGVQLFGESASNRGSVAAVQTSSLNLEPFPESYLNKPILVYYFNAEGFFIENNKANKAADDTVRKLMNQYSIKGFSVQAWISPDYGLQGQALAENWASAVVEQIKGLLGGMGLDVSKYKFETIACGPDWNHFLKLLACSNIESKEQILYIIKNIKNSKNRETELKNMCSIYPELEENIFPLLRRAEVYVY